MTDRQGRLAMRPETSRRGFLEMAGAGLVAGVSGAMARAAKPAAGMRVGADTDKQPNAVKAKGALAMLDFVKASGFDGACFRLMLDLSPTLDPGQLKEVRAHADSQGLFLDAGVGWMNPFNTAERPDIRKFGDGDYRLAIEKMLKAARLIDCTELWAVSAHSAHGRPSYVAYDRFRTDVSWGDQMRAMTKFINSLAPMLRDLKLRVNLEAHGDETSYELIRLIEEIGPDVVGITLDPGNLPLQADVPLDSIRRMAPYIQLSQCKDGILFRTKEGIHQQIRTVGEGVLDWEAALVALGRYHPNLHLCFEDYRAENLLLFSTPKYRPHYPELTEADVKEFERLASLCEYRIKRGEIMSVEEYRKLPWGEKERMVSYQTGAAHIRKILRAKGLGYTS
jgi:sugar phosphate isomerase/epimerase